MIAHVHTDEGTKKVRIRKVKTNHTPEELEHLTHAFNEEVRCLEWVGGVTYLFQRGARFIRSSSLEELFEMYKADDKGLPIPERKCYFRKVKCKKITQ